jgi:hypothetical protein
MKKIISLASLFIVFAACTKEIGVTGPAGAQGTAGNAGKGSAGDTGSIAGQLNLYNEFSIPLDDESGTVVTITSGSLQFTDTTNIAGQYHFSGLATGTYDLSYQKLGYGTMKVFGVSHFGGGLTPTAVEKVYVVQIPQKTAPDSLTATVNNGSYVYFDLHLDTSSLQYQQYYGNLEIFIGTDRNVGPNDYVTMGQTAFSPDGVGGYLGFLYKNDPTFPLPFHTGDSLYAVAYTFNLYLQPNNAYGYYTYPNPGETYIDPQTGREVYPNLSKPSNIFGFIY